MKKGELLKLKLKEFNKYLTKEVQPKKLFMDEFNEYLNDENLLCAMIQTQIMPYYKNGNLDMAVSEYLKTYGEDVSTYKEAHIKTIIKYIAIFCKIILL